MFGVPLLAPLPGGQGGKSRNIRWDGSEEGCSPSFPGTVLSSLISAPHSEGHEWILQKFISCLGPSSPMQYSETPKDTLESQSACISLDMVQFPTVL